MSTKVTYVRPRSEATNRRIHAIRGLAVGPFVVHATPKMWREMDLYAFWRVTHKKSGCLLAFDEDRDKAISKARAVVKVSRKLRVSWNFTTIEEFLKIPHEVRDEIRAAINR